MWGLMNVKEFVDCKGDGSRKHIHRRGQIEQKGQWEVNRLRTNKNFLI